MDKSFIQLQRHVVPFYGKYNAALKESEYWLKYPHALKFPLIKFFSSKKSYRVFESLQTCYGILLLHPIEKNATKGPDHVSYFLDFFQFIRDIIEKIT